MNTKSQDYFDYHESTLMEEVAESRAWKKDGKLRDRYDCYIVCADDGNGNDKNTGEPLLTFDEWLNG